MLKFLKQEDNKNFVTFRVSSAHCNVFEQSNKNCTLFITVAEFVEAVGETAQFWFETLGSVRELVITSFKLVRLDEYLTNEDHEVACIPIDISGPLGLKTNMRVRFVRSGVEVRMSVSDFSQAAIDYFENSPRLPVKGLHPAIERRIRFHWDNLVFKVEEKTQKRA